MSELVKLGIQTKYIIGNKNERIDKLVSMVAFHLYIGQNFVQHTYYYKYAQYLLESVKYILNNSEWHVRLYIDDSLTSPKNKEKSVWIDVLELFTKYKRLQVVHVTFQQYYDKTNSCHKGLLATLFRYLVLFEDNVNVCIFRDIDNIWTEQDFYFTNQWINSGCDGVMYLDNNYRKQEITKLTQYDVLRTGEHFLSVFAGIWGYRLHYEALPPTLWHKLLFYTLDSNKFVYKQIYSRTKFFAIPFIYGFEELAISRVLIPELINQNKRFYVVPIKIWSIDHFKRLFNEQLESFYDEIGLQTNTRKKVEQCILQQYWDMTSCNSGKAQLLLGMLTNIYYKIITKQSKRFSSNKHLIDILINMYPKPFLMSLGLFFFKNFIKYQWNDPLNINNVEYDINQVVSLSNHKINWEQYF